MHMKHLLRMTLLATLAASTCGAKPTVTSEPFGELPDGSTVKLYTLTNDNGLVLKVMDYGAIVTKFLVPDRDGNLGDIVLGYDNLGDYLTETPYFGAAIGRYGNRIGYGTFSLDGNNYQLTINDGDNHLHGGNQGFDKVLWDAEASSSANAASVTFNYLSADGEEGYPGNLNATIVYSLTNDNEFVITYEATTDAPTVVNLTHHTYWNLRGQGHGNILNHELTIFADAYTPVDSGLIPWKEPRWTSARLSRSVPASTTSSSNWPTAAVTTTTGS